MQDVGVLGYVVPLLLEYDTTLGDEAAARVMSTLPFSPGRAKEDSFEVLLSGGLVRTNMQEARSQHALLAARALARLMGTLPAPHNTPANNDAQVRLASSP